LLRVSEFLFDFSPAQCVSRGLERARHLALLSLVVERHAIELRFEIFHLIGHRAFLLRDRLLQLLLLAGVARALRKLLDVGLHVLLLVCKLLRRTHGVRNIAR